MSTVEYRHHPAWQPGQAEIATEGGAGRRPAQDADAPLNQAREAHLAVRLLHSPEGSVLSVELQTD